MEGNLLDVGTESISSKQFNAIRLAFRKGAIFARSFPEIADDYRNGLTLSELAEKYDPNFEKSPRIAQTIIWFALRELIPDEDERRKIGEGHTHLGWNPDQRKEAGERLTLSRGHKVYTSTEQKYLRMLIRHPAVWHQSGRHVGHPDMNLVADLMRLEFGVEHSQISLKQKSSRLVRNAR